ncbi:MAG: hypothetical protein IKU41_03740 [Clostridia bacterium]|nr:hypothetical protein [Clostridia bacterium]
MSKKIIAASLLMLAIVVLFAACKKDDYEVSFTVPMEDGEVITVYKDDEGNEFVTNVEGDKIPVTTDKDGFYDDITSLVTETTTKKQDNTTTSTTKADKDNTTTSTTKADKDNTTTKPTETTTNKPISIDDTTKKQDSISWQEIKDAAKKANKS